MKYTLTLAVVVGFAAAPLDGQRAKQRPRIDLGTSAPVRENPGRNDPAFMRLLPCCRVTAVNAAASTISVNDESAARGFKMTTRRRPASSMKQYRLGQLVYMNQLGTRAAVTSFPVTLTQKDNIVRSSWKMTTTVTLSNTGRLDGITKTKTAEALRGFTGGVLVGITDLDGNVLYYTKLRKYGVDGTAKPGGKSSRTEKWSEEVPKEALDKAGAVVIWHSHQPQNRFPGAVNWVQKNWQCIVEVYKIYKAATDTSQTPPPGGTSQAGVWEETTPEETLELLSTCKNLI